MLQQKAREARSLHSLSDGTCPLEVLALWASAMVLASEMIDTIASDGTLRNDVAYSRVAAPQNVTEKGWGRPLGCSTFHIMVLVGLHLCLVPVVSLFSTTSLISISPFAMRVSMCSSWPILSERTHGSSMASPTAAAASAIALSQR
jgi:hypothetical protein